MAASAHPITRSMPPAGRRRPPAPPDEIISPWTGQPPRLNKYGRDLDSPSELERSRTVWLRKPSEFTGKQDFTGYVALPHAFFADLARLKRGAVQLLLLQYGWSQSYGRERKPNEKPTASTGDLSVAALAQIMGCTERQVEDDLADAHDRRLIRLKRVGPKMVRWETLWWNWEALPDYSAERVEKKPPATEGGSQDEPVVLLKKPAYVRAGQSSRPVPVTTEVKAFRLVNESTANLGLDAVVIAGELLLTAHFENASPIEISNLVSKSGSALPSETLRPLAATTGPQKVRSTVFNNLTSKSGSALPSIDEKDIQALARQVLGSGLEPAYARILASLAPFDCPRDFISFELNRRAGNGTLTARILKRWFVETLPVLWDEGRDRWALQVAEGERAAAIATQTSAAADRHAEVAEQAEVAWNSMAEAERAPRLMRAASELKPRVPHWKQLTKDQQARMIEDAARAELFRELEAVS